jgi:hypothetical protein
VAAALGVDTRCPSESTIRRLLDAVIGSFVEQLCAEPPPAGRRRVLAVDGKTLCGSRRSARPDGSSTAPTT